MISDLLHVYAPPTRTEYDGETEVRWCFGCRKSTTHKHAWLITLGEAGAYYDPHFFRQCEECKEDRTEFPDGYGL